MLNPTKIPEPQDIWESFQSEPVSQKIILWQKLMEYKEKYQKVMLELRHEYSYIQERLAYQVDFLKKNGGISSSRLSIRILEAAP